MVIKSHKLRTKIITASAVIVIFVAVIFSLFRIAIPYITDYGDTIEAELSRQLGMPVKIESVDADIQWLTPRLNLLGVKVYSPKSEKIIFSLAEINFSLGWVQSFKKLRPELAFVSISGLDIEVMRDVNGIINVQGYGINVNDDTEESIPPEVIGALSSSSIYLLDSRIHWVDKLHNSQSLKLENVNIALLNASPRHQLSVDMDLPAAYGDHVRFILDIEGDLDKPTNWKGKLYTSVGNLHLARWFDDYWQSFGFVGAGDLDADIWMQWDSATVQKIEARINANDMALHYMDDSVRSWKLDHIDGLVRWESVVDGWAVDVRELVINRDKRAWPKASSVSLHMNENRQYVEARASFLRLEDLAYLGGLVTNFIPIKDFNWNEMFDTYRPRGDLFDLSLHMPLQSPGDARIDARFKNLGYDTTESLPVASGLDGRLEYDGSRTLLNLDSLDVQLTYADLFRTELKLKALYGDISLFRKQDSWYLVSDDLELATPHLSTRSRLRLSVPDAGSPFLDMVTRFKKGDGSQKSLYLPTAIMPDEAVDWLDRAIVTADVTQGGFLFHGAFQDYPFAGGEGVMQALFDIENATLQYMPDWPTLENLKASVHFNNRSLHIDQARGTIMNADIYDTRLHIADLEKAHLDIQGKVKTELPELLNFVSNSPLKKHFSSYALGLQTEGPAKLDLDLQIPLYGEDTTRVNGLLSFQGNDVLFPQHGYSVSDLRGELSFTESSFQGESFSARVDGHPIDMKVATLEESPGSRVRIDMAGYFRAQTLLMPLPGMRAYLDGGADWEIGIDIPKYKGSSLLELELKSDLRGISSSFPSDFAKTSDEQGRFSMALELIDEDNMDIDVELEGRYKVRAERRHQQWYADVRSERLSGNARFMEDFSVDSPAQINIDYVDVDALLSTGEGASKFELRANDIPPLSVQVRELNWGNYHLADINVETERADRGMQITHFEAHAPTVNIMGKGSWLSSWRFEDSTTLEFTLDTHDLGKTLSEFRITDSIKETDGQVSVNWSWPARPYEFRWDLVKGNATLDLEDGKLTDIDVGAGRLIGILNFETLLSMDFGNQMAKGFAFDNLTGDLHFDSGNAYTRDVTIESKVADITMDGRIGLSDEDYDQIVTVIPGVGSTLTVIGAVTGGPVTAAAVHLFQKIFGINKIAEYRYSVKGSWKDPEVKLLSAPEGKVKSGQTDEDSF